MKKTVLVLMIAAFSGFAITGFVADKQKAEVPEWKMDPAHSSVSFMTTHLGTPFLGNFSKFDASVKFDPADLANSLISFTIDAGSINTNIEKRDEHLKSDAFFDVAKYPNMTFKSEKIVKKTPGNNKEFVVKGSLTIKDVTKKVEVPLIITASGPHPFSKDKLMLGLKTAFKIMRNDYHVGSGDWLSTAVIGDEVDVNVFAEFSSSK